MRWPFSRITGGPLPRPRPDPVCGAIAARTSATEDAPTAEISASLNVSVGGMSVSTEPLRRVPSTRISRFAPASSATVLSSTTTSVSPITSSAANAEDEASEIERQIRLGLIRQEIRFSVMGRGSEFHCYFIARLWKTQRAYARQYLSQFVTRLYGFSFNVVAVKRAPSFRN